MSQACRPQPQVPDRSSLPGPGPRWSTPQAYRLLVVQARPAPPPVTLARLRHFRRGHRWVAWNSGLPRVPIRHPAESVRTTRLSGRAWGYPARAVPRCEVSRGVQLVGVSVRTTGARRAEPEPRRAVGHCCAGLVTIRGSHRLRRTQPALVSPAELRPRTTRRVTTVEARRRWSVRRSAHPVRVVRSAAPTSRTRRRHPAGSGAPTPLRAGCGHLVPGASHVARRRSLRASACRHGR